MIQHRIHWIDWSKCILIYFVVLAHYGGIPSFVDNWICAFHMPAFFMISGFLHKELPLTVSLQKNVKRLLIPALLFSLICWAHTIAVDIIKQIPLTMDENFYKPLLGLIRYDRPNAMPQCGVIWFLEVLFICKLVIDYVGRYRSERVLIYISIVCIILTGFIYWCNLNDKSWSFLLQRSFASFPFVAIGYIAKRNELLNKFRQIGWLPFVFASLYIIGVMVNGRVGIASWRFGHSIMLYYGIALLGCLSFFSIIKKIRFGGVFAYAYFQRNNSYTLPS